MRIGSLTFAFALLASLVQAESPAPIVSIDTTPAIAIEELPNRYTGELLSRDYLSGDWAGNRSKLAERGLTFQMYNTNFYQGVARGGNAREFEFGGRLDYLVDVDGEKLGLWRGLFLDMHAETRYGTDINPNTGLLAPPNLAMNFPRAGGNISSITGLKVTQALSDQVAFFAGKINTIDQFPLRYNTGGATGLPYLNGFQSSALVFNPIATRTVPYSAAGAGMVLLKDELPWFSFTVIDPEERATKAAENLFVRGVTLIPDFVLRGKLFGRPALLNIGGTYSNSRYRSLDPTTYLDLLQSGQLLQALANGGPTETNSWSVYINGYQSLWVDPCDEKRNWGIFGAWGISDGNPNPLKYSFSAGIGGRSMLPGRNRDSFGVGYYYLGLSDNVKTLASPFTTLRDEYGVELFYNVALTPWCRLTPNFTVVQPFTAGTETMISTGLRLQVSF
jgi:porin